MSDNAARREAEAMAAQRRALRAADEMKKKQGEEFNLKKTCLSQ